MRSVFSLLPITIVVLWFGVAHSANHCGDIWGEWSPVNNPHNVTCEVRVPPGSTLVILPGCYIEFQDHYKFIVDTSATLYAVGTDADSIIFTAADTSTGWHGIRFYSASNGCQLSYCLIEYGKAVGSNDDEYGGGIYCNDSSLTISNNTISNNYADVSGGGIFCDNSSPTIENNTIQDNSAQDGGGIYIKYNSNPVISRNTISFNTATAHGGGISSVDTSSYPTIDNNIIIHNDAIGGGGLFLHFQPSGYPIITNNTIAYNVATAQPGGGILSREDSNPMILNTIVCGNNPNDIGCDAEGTVTITYSDVCDSLWPGTGNISCDPIFCDTASSNYYLADTSCCAGAGQGGVDIGAYGVGCGLTIPTLSEWGLLIMGLLLLAVGTVAVVRRRKAASSIVD